MIPGNIVHILALVLLQGLKLADNLLSLGVNRRGGGTGHVAHINRDIPIKRWGTLAITVFRLRDCFRQALTSDSHVRSNVSVSERPNSQSRFFRHKFEYASYTSIRYDGTVMKQLLYFNPYAISSPEGRTSDIEKFSAFSKIFKSRITLVDRTGTVSTPVRTKSLFPIPTFRPMSKTFEEICNERGTELLQRAERLGIPLYTFWSGGIDSTLVLISLLKNATPEQKKNMVVLMSGESIAENPNFYRDHIYGQVRRDSSVTFFYLLGGDCLIVNGEHNDQLFGAETFGGLIERFGANMLHQPYNRDQFITYYSEKTGDPAVATFYTNLFERVRAVAPRDIVSNQDVVWWFSFAVKWQSVYFRGLAYTTPSNARRVTQAYLDERYEPFYNTDDFQLWSMNNPDKKIKDAWNTYKWPCKDIIYGFTKDAEYRNTKTKKPSLHALITRQPQFDFIDESMHFSHEMDPAEYYNPDNDFFQRPPR
jgi:hypothetical protein